MRKFSYTIRDEVGIHARPAGMLVNAAKATGCRVTIEKGGRSADACKLFSVMGLGVKCGDTVTVSVEGASADAALEALEEFFKTNL